MSTTVAPARSPRWSLRRRVLVWIALLLALLAGTAYTLVELAGVAPRLLGPYIARRASGHGPLEGVGRALSDAQVWLDRGELTPQLDYPNWAAPPAHTSSGAMPSSTSSTPSTRAVSVTDTVQLPLALVDAQPGDVITLAPGIYHISGNALAVHRAGLPDAPITLRAEQPGTVTLEFNVLEGFYVSAPYWIFENLSLTGVCKKHSECAHAFHVVGGAHHVVIRNNVLRDFDAHIKINGAGGQFPDAGRIQNNQLINTAPRRTDQPVTPIDLVAANDWLIEENLIADFIKDGGDRTSYGAFAKGGGAGNIFARNLVLCEHRLRGTLGADMGRRIGLSLGGGGSDPRVCRDNRCVVEQERGVLRDNLIASCSDDGIYINRAAQTQLLNNTVVDTAGIYVRFGESAARAEGNWVNAPLYAGDGASLHARDNHTASLASMYLALTRLQPLPCSAQNPPWAAHACRNANTKAPHD